MGGTLSPIPDDQSVSSPCPCCGYCKHCGRSNVTPYQWPYQWPYHTFYPYSNIPVSGFGVNIPVPGIYPPVVTNGQVQTYGISNEITGWQGEGQAES